VARELPSVVQPQDEVVLQERAIDRRHALLQLLVQLKWRKTLVMFQFFFRRFKFTHCSYPNLNPHAEEDGSCVKNQPSDAASKQLDALEKLNKRSELEISATLVCDFSYLKARKQKSEQNDEGGDNPDDEDALVAYVEEGKAHVGRQLLHDLDVILNSQLKKIEVD
jgi:hypothetical protein